MRASVVLRYYMPGRLARYGTRALGSWHAPGLQTHTPLQRIAFTSEWLHAFRRFACRGCCYSLPVGSECPAHLALRAGPPQESDAGTSGSLCKSPNARPCPVGVGWAITGARPVRGAISGGSRSAQKVSEKLKKSLLAHAWVRMGVFRGVAAHVSYKVVPV